jgi:hypothetical protein
MSERGAYINTPAAAWAWLTRRLSELDEAPGRSANRAWRDFRNQYDGQMASGTSVTEWPSDFWIARTQQIGLGEQLYGTWAIPERLDQWTALEMRDAAAYALPDMQKTKNGPFLEFLSRADAGPAASESNPVLGFHELIDSSNGDQDQAMISTDQIRAWLTTAFGSLLIGVAFSLADDDQDREMLTRATMSRISSIDTIRPEDKRFGFMDYGCDRLYNFRPERDGLRQVPSRQGQGLSWRDHWAWLSTAQDAEAMQTTLQLAGSLLINEPLLTGLDLTIRNGNADLQKRALCVTRRWLLTAKVMAWLFEALKYDWTLVRPEDLACFAFAALSPAWPRRGIAVSHRSAEAKPTLSKLHMWKSPHAAIDASYIPAWETNTGMIWNLFAPVPLIVRVKSPAYSDSEWCSREHEMFQYLIDHSDFLEGRAIIDIGVTQLPKLDTALFQENATSSSRSKPFLVPREEFPPISFVLSGEVPLDHDLAILRAAGALRLIHAHVQDPRRANELASAAAAGHDIAIEAPTNNPDGWAGYGEIFRDLEAALPSAAPDGRLAAGSRQGYSGGPPLPIGIPVDYSDRDAWLDKENSIQIPDLRHGQHRLADILAAYEWRRTVLGWFNDEDLGDKVVVDVSGYTPEDWNTLSRFSVGRGLAALDNITPIWIMQRADQGAHLWPGLPRHPIFTRHVRDQFSWLAPVVLDPSWLIYFLVNSGLDLGSDLQTAIVVAVARSERSVPLEFEPGTGDTQLRVPPPKSFFNIRADALSDVRRRLGIPLDPKAR